MVINIIMMILIVIYIHIVRLSVTRLKILY